MSSIAARTYLTPEEYLTFERKAITKHEYLSGEIVAMSGASNAHNLITGDVFAELHGQLKGGKCLVYTSDMRVKTSPGMFRPILCLLLSSDTTAYFYPDITVVCDKPRFEDHTFDTLLNPIVVIEVLSPSTETYDKGEKFARYQQLVSLQEYILVSQDHVRVQHYLRRETQWLQTEFRELNDVMPLNSIECTLCLRDIYSRVDLSD